MSSPWIVLGAVSYTHLHQLMKARGNVGCTNNLIWYDKYLTREAKTRVYTEHQLMKARGNVGCMNNLIQINEYLTQEAKTSVYTEHQLMKARGNVGCMNNLIPVSYTHLDVYKRQV